MGIGVSYTGHGENRTFELDGVPSVGSMAASVLGAQHTPMLPFNSLMQSIMPNMPSMADNAGSGKRLMSNGSIFEVGDEICLRGEEGGVPGGRRVYGSNNGQRGFFSLSELDPYAGGGMMLNGTGNTPDGGDVSLDGNNGATVRFGGRLDMQIDCARDGKRWVTVKEFYRLATITPNGRIVRISRENERLVLKFEVSGGEGSGSGKYGVKPVFSGSGLSALLFGTEEELDNNSPSSVVNTTTCPNAGGS